MTDIDEGYFFWKRVDMVRPKYVTLKQIVDDAHLNYHLVKVQRSCNRIPKALEAAKLAEALNVSLEWLLTGKVCEVEPKADVFDTHRRAQMRRIFEVLLSSDPSTWHSVENTLGIGKKQDR